MHVWAVKSLGFVFYHVSQAVAHPGIYPLVSFIVLYSLHDISLSLILFNLFWVPVLEPWILAANQEECVC